MESLEVSLMYRCIKAPTESHKRGELAHRHRPLFRQNKACFLSAIIVNNMTDLITMYQCEISKHDKDVTDYIIKFMHSFNYRQYSNNKLTMLIHTLNAIKSQTCKIQLLDALFINIVRENYFKCSVLVKITDMCVEIGYKVPYYYFSVDELIIRSPLRKIYNVKCHLPEGCISYASQCMMYVRHSCVIDFLRWLLGDN